MALLFDIGTFHNPEGIIEWKLFRHNQPFRILIIWPYGIWRYWHGLSLHPWSYDILETNTLEDDVYIGTGVEEEAKGHMPSNWRQPIPEAYPPSLERIGDHQTNYASQKDLL
jgi:hypothetical protein